MRTLLWFALVVAALGAWVRHAEDAGDVGVPADATAAVCAIAKDEGPYIDEWVRYHLALGFDAVYVYDNSDANDLADLPSRHPVGRVHVRHWPGKRRQVPAYNHFLGAADGHTWAAFLDVDEFLVLRKHGDVKSLLKEHCRRGALGVNWLLFGSSGKAAYEPGCVVSRFRRRGAHVNPHVKSIVRVADVREMDVHNPSSLVWGTHQRDTSGRAFSGSQHPNGPTDVAVIHHYFTKSHGEFLQKRARGMATSTGIRGLDEFARHDENEVEDASAMATAHRLGVC